MTNINKNSKFSIQSLKFLQNTALSFFIFFIFFPISIFAFERNYNILHIKLKLRFDDQYKTTEMSGGVTNKMSENEG